jgi:hypothetical protein
MRKCALLLFLLATLLFSSLSFAQVDKVLHTSAGFGITITVSSITNKPTLGLMAGIGAGIGKELWDRNRPGHDASVRDALATAAGSGGAFVLWKYVLARKHRPTVAAVPQQTPASDRGSLPNAPSSIPVARGGGGT